MLKLQKINYFWNILLSSRNKYVIQLILKTNSTNVNFTIFSDTPVSIPHYIKINYKNKSMNLLIAIPGRRQACQTCGSTRHWTSQCHILNEETIQAHTIANTTTTVVPTEYSPHNPRNDRNPTPL